MKSFEDPIQFDIIKKFDGIEVIYTNLMEVSQGGPEIGDLAINGKRIVGKFGGPVLYQNGFIFAPVYRRNFFSSGFQLAKIDVVSLRIEYVGGIENLIFLDKIESNIIHYYGDLNRLIKRQIRIHE